MHRWLAKRARPAVSAAPLGHDAAVLKAASGRTVLCVDQCIEGVHFAPDIAPRRVGHKAAARALSDLAATAARPRALLIALAAPADRSESWLRAVLSAASATGAEFGAELIGGDLAAADGPAHVSVTACGNLESQGRPPGRARARAGQLVVATGAMGGSALGRHATFTPRVKEGLWLAARGATAMMDISDGLAWDLHRLARAAGVAIELTEVPVHRDARKRARTTGRTPEWHALHDGEDHELVATVDRGLWAGVERSARRACPGLTVIGSVREGSGLFVPGEAGRPRRWRPREGGWRHGEH